MLIHTLRGKDLLPYSAGAAGCALSRCTCTTWHGQSMSQIRMLPKTSCGDLEWNGTIQVAFFPIDFPRASQQRRRECLCWMLMMAFYASITVINLRRTVLGRNSPQRRTTAVHVDNNILEWKLPWNPNPKPDSELLWSQKQHDMNFANETLTWIYFDP